jgi:hypothetical protein
MENPRRSRGDARLVSAVDDNRPREFTEQARLCCPEVWIEDPAATHSWPRPLPLKPSEHGVFRRTDDVLTIGNPLASGGSMVYPTASHSEPESDRRRTDHSRFMGKKASKHRPESLLQRIVPARWRRRSTSDDVQVRKWKAAWSAGAQARWRGAPRHSTLNDSRSPAAAAWDAGWLWADRQPDRRVASRPRLAHPLRRDTDSPARLIGRAGALGVSTFMLARWLWRARRKRRHVG